MIKESKSMKENISEYSYMSGNNAMYIEHLYTKYLRDPRNIPEDWRITFDSLKDLYSKQKLEESNSKQKSISKIDPQIQNKLEARLEELKLEKKHLQEKNNIIRLIQSYRKYGHQKANLDPLGLWKYPNMRDLSLSRFQLENTNVKKFFEIEGFHRIGEKNTLDEIISMLEKTYCRNIGIEFMHIVDDSQKKWFKKRLELNPGIPNYDNKIKSRLLELIIAAEGFEKDIATRYPGSKRFSLEGAESLIPLLDEFIYQSMNHGVKEIYMGMTHRGRLNVLVNIFGKNPDIIFKEFEDRLEDRLDSGDVKYHQGYCSDITRSNKKVRLTLAYNPSHLEIIYPVMEGSVRARQDSYYDVNPVIPLCIHGDAAFVAQGVVMETMQMSQTRGFKTGGTVHVVINNQIGFTVHEIEDARSTQYCTELAKMIQAPIFHVNSDDPESVIFITKVAIEYRMRFKRDVVIDLFCYRRRGHSEADSPESTQPLMYQRISSLPTVCDQYASRLIRENGLNKHSVKEKISLYRERMNTNTIFFNSSTKVVSNPDLYPKDDCILCDHQKIKNLSMKMLQIPKKFSIQSHVSKIYKDREKMQCGKLPIDWGYAENMAYATILDSGYSIRITGQDVGRGTFGHRHAVLHNQENNDIYVPLKSLHKDQAHFHIYDSLLSEEGVLAFEYGYAITNPNTLVIWEAQFGDFANGAQVVIDQFISSGESKWGYMCGITLLLPHGYEGQGPEHSSARLERYLQLCAKNNIKICVPTTPSQIYHLLLRQITSKPRKPLIVITPKSLLRHSSAVSSFGDLSRGRFEPFFCKILSFRDKIKRVILCTGKIYYDLIKLQEREFGDKVVVICIEELYPFPKKEILANLASYRNLETVVWCQEEPMNQGAWNYININLPQPIDNDIKVFSLKYTGRNSCAAPASGYASFHFKEQKRLLMDAFIT